MKKTFGIQWHVTNECDQRCQHCYIWKKFHIEGIRITPSMNQCKIVVEKVLRFCEEMDVLPYFSITGGDPLLYDNIWQLLEFINKKGVNFTILGNPFHLSQELAHRLKGLGCLSYQMSLDGMKQIHDSMRKEGSFEATLKALDVLHLANIRSMIMMTISLINYKDAPDVAKLCAEKMVGNFAFARYCPTHGDVEFNMSPTAYREFLSIMWDTYSHLINSDTKFTLKDHLWVPFLYEKGLYKLNQKQGIVFDGCNCGIAHMTLLPNGAIYACRRFESKVGNVYLDDLKPVFLSAEMEKYRNISNLSGCKTCELLYYCRGCHAVSAGTTGDFFDKDPQCWRL